MKRRNDILENICISLYRMEKYNSAGAICLPCFIISGSINSLIRHHILSNIYSNYRIKRNEVILIVKEEHIQRDTSDSFYNICSGKEYQ